MIRRLRDRLRQFFLRPSERQEQLLEVRRRAAEPRLRVRTGAYVCGVCKKDFGSLERLRQHTIVCFLEWSRAQSHHAGSVHPVSVTSPRATERVSGGEAISEGGAR